MVIGLINLLICMIVLTIVAVPFGLYMGKVYMGQITYLAWLENIFYKIIGINPNVEMKWKDYVIAVLGFSLLCAFGLFILLIFQADLPLNPYHAPNMSWDLALNSAVSFSSNTDWQSYSGETQASYLSQSFGMCRASFLSVATGMAVAVAMIRGIASVEKKTIGNFWQDLIRSILYILMPLALIFSIVLVKLGVPQNFNNYVTATVIQPAKITTVVTGKNITKVISSQTIAMGPIASQEAIKILGNNGGGFFSANSSHPYENPNAISNFLDLLAMLLIPAGFCFAFGAIVGDKRQGISLYLVMASILIIAAVCLMLIELNGNPLLQHLNIDQIMNTFQSGGNMEGKETRFGIFGSSLFTAITTATSTGATNSLHDSLMPLGGLIPMFLIQLSEVIFGGAGCGIYSMLTFVILAVFIAGLMIGRTPEYLGKKIESFEMKMVAIIILIGPLLVLLETAISLVVPAGLAGISNPSAHGLSQVLYAFSSAANNNGSAFAGLNANTPYYNIMLAIAMFLGRYVVIVPILAIAGSFALKKRVPVTSGTMPTHGGFFLMILVGVIFIVGALTYIPALALGPIVEHLMLF